MFSFFQNIDILNINVIVDCHTISHVTQPRLVREHIMRVVLVVVNDRFPEIDFVTVLPAEIHETLVPIVADPIVII